MSSDVRDILSIEDSSSKKQNLLDKDVLLSSTEKKPPKKSENQKRPRNIPRELWGLKDTFGGDFPSILPAPEVQIYKQPKAQIAGKVRSWVWNGFKNSARSDNLILHHWKRADLIDKEKDYYFAQFNKKPVLPKYTDREYNEHLNISGWTREETNYLMQMVEKFDMRFILVNDRWDRDLFKTNRTVEDIKERFYMILDVLNTIRSDMKSTPDPAYGPGKGWGIDTGCLKYHADHEKRRKKQLERLYSRTQEQIAEEEELAKALHRIEILKRERQKKTTDLQKLLSQADFVVRNSDSMDCNFPISVLGGELARSLSSANQSRKKSVPSNMLQMVGSNVVFEGLKFPDLNKNPGVHLRSSEMKFPPLIGIKKTRFIDGFLSYFNIDPSPIPSEDIVEIFNSLRADILLIQELYATLSHLEYEICLYREKYQKRLNDAGNAPEIDRKVPTSLVNPLHHFNNSNNLQLGQALQAAIRAADVKQKTTITPLNISASNVSPPGTRSTSTVASEVTNLNTMGSVRKRRRPPSDDRLFSPASSDSSRKSMKKIRVAGAGYMMKKRL